MNPMMIIYIYIYIYTPIPVSPSYIVYADARCTPTHVL